MNEHENVSPDESNFNSSNSIHSASNPKCEVEDTYNSIPDSQGNIQTEEHQTNQSSNQLTNQENESELEVREVSEDYSGNESDEEETDDDKEDTTWDFHSLETCFPSQRPGFVREEISELPENVTVLTTDDNCKVYLVGTAHFSKESQDEVVKTIEMTNPDIVLLELCQSRINMLNYDEETLLKEAKDISFAKFKLAVKQNGLVQGVMQLLLLSMSAHLTKQLGMAPGGEFRVAVQAARRINGCQVVLGDRSVQVTLHRALASLSWWQTIRLALYIITSKDPISKEDVEKFKQKDFLEAMLKEMTGEFPALSCVFVEERDLYLAKSLYTTARLLPSLNIHNDNQDDEEKEDQSVQFVPSVVVGVVGIGHTPGIAKYWDNIKDRDLNYLLKVPKPSKLGITMKWTLRAALVALLSWTCYKGYTWTRALF